MKGIVNFILASSLLLGLSGCSVYVVENQPPRRVVRVQQPTYLEIMAAQRMQATDVILREAQCPPPQLIIYQQPPNPWLWNRGHRGHH